MVTHIFVVESNCVDPSREDEYNQWYDDIDLPDVLAIKGILRATRYICEADLNSRYERAEVCEGKGKYLTVYEIETTDIDSVLRSLDAGVLQMEKRGRLTDLIEVTARRLYKTGKMLSK
ncbi:MULTISPECIES: hypothetical protein [unclassified Ruegeria]|uniref:hypothetical protein n=1 Tax=unclassified Ruegeria TaxID=2625375 RepID=UPI001489911D|nr:MULTISPECIES: hypothetical protein [unclassified Ruegeria]NOD35479.1 hypothetical protein [Ruegeria sp. HKCCD7296]NOD49322.1 hypothetical protein [Ruegeria sp. HKCCD5849]NOD53379.1 hypothetical protein [Ruegeria sp. HKCCD5851]NOD69703.1 hypothetical protein [Ruegeria sp. HKCCD7303]NOE35562.1 hypothetical protein [Ruegeria sp. HKCCD7318]